PAPLTLPPELAHIPHRIDMALVADADIDVLVEAARTGLIDFPGGTLSIERTRAMTMIDVDGSLAPLALNCAAAAAIGRALRLFQITGPIGIDFVGMASKADRQAVDAALGAALAPLGPLERTALNGFGFAQIIRPRTGPCVPEQLCGTTPGRLSVESQALALLREAARSTGIGPRTLTARPVVIDLLRRWTDVVAEVERWTGVPLNLVSDAGVQGYGHVHVTPA
ncbi:MAG: ribonuclease E/G, partial [Sphingomonadaceae bacterium]